VSAATKDYRSIARRIVVGSTIEALYAARRFLLRERRLFGLSDGDQAVLAEVGRQIDYWEGVEAGK
jgi:hypothetical protein